MGGLEGTLRSLFLSPFLFLLMLHINRNDNPTHIGQGSGSSYSASSRSHWLKTTRHINEYGETKRHGNHPRVAVFISAQRPSIMTVAPSGISTGSSPAKRTPDSFLLYKVLYCFDIGVRDSLCHVAGSTKECVAV